MSNTEEYIKILHKEMEQFIDEGYERLDKQEQEMRELGLIMYGDYNYYIQNPEEYEKDKKICELENKVERLEHRLSNCIEPKFKIGQEVWIVFDRTIFGERLKTVEKTKIFGINVTDFIDYYFQTLPCIAREEEIFATEEEAKAKLRSLEDENN